MRLHPKDWLALGFADPVNDISLTMRSTRMRILQIRSIGTDRSRMIGLMGVGAFTVCAMASSPERISAAIAIPCTLHSSSEETTYGSRIRASASFVSSPVRPANGSRNASPSAPPGTMVSATAAARSLASLVRVAKIDDSGGERGRLFGRNVEAAQQPLEQTRGCSIQIDEAADIGDSDRDGGIAVLAAHGRAVRSQSRVDQGPAVAVAEPQRNEAHQAVSQCLSLGMSDELACRTHVETNCRQEHQHN